MQEIFSDYAGDIIRLMKSVLFVLDLSGEETHRPSRED
jgi:hypothetical protein